MTDNLPICRWCKKPVTKSSYTSRDKGSYCREECYLNYMIKQRSQLERDKNEISMAEALVEALAAALDAREHETGMHSKRVACHTQVLARNFNQNKEWLQQVYWGSLLHDIGKIAIPDAVLLKEGPLSESEWSVMRSHPQHGYNIVAGISFMSTAAKIILCHEECFDGSGYPKGLSGNDIPWEARLFAVIDTLDAMTSNRPYRKGISFDAAKKEILLMSGIQFDPKAVDMFLAEEVILREMVEMKCSEFSL